MNVPPRVKLSIAVDLVDLPSPRAVGSAKLEHEEAFASLDELSAFEQAIANGLTSARALMKRARWALIVRTDPVEQRRAFSAHLLKCRQCDVAFDSYGTLLGMLVNWRHAMCAEGGGVFDAMDAWAKAQPVPPAPGGGP